MAKTFRIQTADGVNLFGQSAGEGPLVIALHGGLGLDSTYLKFALAPLISRARTVCYDHRGHGQSTGRETLGNYGRSILVSDAEEIRAGCGAERTIVFGHSYGGFIALEYAVKFPDRVAGLILCCTAASVTHVPAALERAESKARPEEWVALTTLLTSPPQTDNLLRELWRAITPLYFADHEPTRSAVLDGTRFSAAGFAAGARWISDYDVESLLPQIKCPVLLLHGRHDWLMGTSQTSGVLLRTLPQPQLVSFESSGHYPFVEEPEVYCAELLRWFDSFEW